MDTSLLCHAVYLHFHVYKHPSLFFLQLCPRKTNVSWPTYPDADAVRGSFDMEITRRNQVNNTYER